MPSRKRSRSAAIGDANLRAAPDVRIREIQARRKLVASVPE